MSAIESPSADHPDYQPRVTVGNRRAVSSLWADADQVAAAVAHAGKRDGTYVLTGGGWALVAVSPVVDYPGKIPGGAAALDDAAAVNLIAAGTETPGGGR